MMHISFLFLEETTDSSLQACETKIVWQNDQLIHISEVMEKKWLVEMVKYVLKYTEPAVPCLQLSCPLTVVLRII